MQRLQPLILRVVVCVACVTEAGFRVSGDDLLGKILDVLLVAAGARKEDSRLWGVSVPVALALGPHDVCNLTDDFALGVLYAGAVKVNLKRQTVCYSELEFVSNFPFMSYPTFVPMQRLDSIDDCFQ